jgi:energy-coupling factor transporter ATP-binding protein EcfA2
VTVVTLSTMTGMESFFDPLTSGLVGILLDTAKKVGGKFVQAIGDRTKASAALKQYADKYTARYGTLKLLGMSKPIPLEAIYTKVKFLDELSIRQFVPLTTLEQTYRKKQKRGFRMYEPAAIDASAVVNSNQYLMVLGVPGAGKSTFLRRTGLEALKAEKGTLKHRSIPVMLELKRFNSNEIDLTQSIAEELSNFGFPTSSDFAISLLEQGKLLILLDGLDEVPKTNLNTVIDEIQAFVTRYDQNRYIASCRIAAHRSTWGRFRDIELADFDDEQIQQFIYNWFQTQQDCAEETAKRCWTTLNDPGNICAKELAQTPLLLTFLCMVYDHTQGFPSQRATLYRKALDILLEEWAAEKRINHEVIYQGLNSDLEKVLLSEIAYNGIVNEQFFFTQQELIDQIKGFLSDTFDHPKYLDGKAVLDAIAVQQGILVQRAEDVFSFSHLTLQEYLAAQYLKENFDYVPTLLKEHLEEERWQEVFLMLAGLIHSVKQVDKFLLQMEELAQASITTPKLKALLNWTNLAICGATSTSKPAAKRAAVIALLLELARAHALDIDLNIGLAVILDYNRMIAYRLAHHLDIDLSPIHTVDEVLLSLRESDSTHDIDLRRDQALSYSLDVDVDLFRARKFSAKQVFGTADFDSLIAQLEALQRTVPDASQPLEIRKKFAADILEAWYEALQFNSGWFDWSESEVKALGNYLYINALIVTCKKAALRSSSEVWKGIEERILIPKEN